MKRKCDKHVILLITVCFLLFKIIIPITVLAQYLPSEVSMPLTNPATGLPYTTQSSAIVRNGNVSSWTITDTATGKTLSKFETTYADATSDKKLSWTRTDYKTDGKITEVSSVSYATDGVTKEVSRRNVYDSTGQNVISEIASTYGSTGDLPETTLFKSYDTTGHLTSEFMDVYVSGNSNDPNGFYTNQSGQKVRVIDHRSSKAYDANGDIIWQSTQKGDGKGGLISNSDSFINTPSASETYQPLAPIKGPDGQVLNGATDFPGYLQAIYRIGIGLCFVLGVIMFTWAGIEYIVSESMNTKGDAKSRMTNALIGLAIALVSYILLNTINPDLLKLQNINVNVTTTK